MHPRHLALLLPLACTPAEPPVEAPPPHWVYAPRPPAWQLGSLKGRFGRSQAPQRPFAGGIIGEPSVPLRAPMLWSVPGAGPARAIVFGFEGVRPAVELLDLDAGRVVWRDTATCTGPVVAVVENLVICADAKGIRTLGLDGKARWTSDKPIAAVTGDRIAQLDATTAIVLGAGDGVEQARVKVPAASTILASCGKHELYIHAADKLVRISDIGNNKVAATWAVPLATIDSIEPCEGASVVVTSGPTMFALARATGKLTGRVDGVRGHWRARDDSDRIEIATTNGVTSWSRDLVGPGIDQNLPALGAPLDARGDRRLVRASAFTAVVLDRTGVRAYLPFAATTAALGGTSITGASSTIHRVELPERSRRVVRVPAQRAGVALPAELRDLPASAPLESTHAIAKADTGKHAVAAIALDPGEPAVVYAAALEAAPTETSVSAIAAVDLGARTWRWQRADGCGPGTPLALVLATDLVACAARGVTSTVRATTRSGAASWEWETDSLDGLGGAGGVVLAYAGDRVTVLETGRGHVLGRFASDDGATMRATALVIGGLTWLVTFEGGRIVVRLPNAGMLPVWSLRVDGVVRALSPSGEGVLVALEDGDAYRIELATAAITPMPGLGLAWAATAELVTGHTAGGPIPGIPLPIVRRPMPAGRPKPPVIEGRNPEPPDLWTPIPPPPPLGQSWQYTFYELSGGVRARNDYALAAPVAPAATRGPTGSPVVVAHGAGLRQVIVLDPRTGDPLRRVALPEDASGLVFGTIVDGSPVAGVVLAAPLRAVLF
ncbi:MAG: hypothetical protein ABI867_28980 [Kofleriaceae bacterium]